MSLYRKFFENSINASILGPVLSGGMMEWGTTSVLLAGLGRPVESEST